MTQPLAALSPDCKLGAAVMPAGALIVRVLMDKLQHKQLRASDRGLRHGVLIDRFF